MSKKLFISDLHLSPTNPELTQLACDFLQQNKTELDEVYILGDIFNTWLGDDLVPEEFDGFVRALQELVKQGCKLFLMVGNRDFMLGHKFAGRVGAVLLPDGHLIDIAGHKTLLMHGDSLCVDDISYQRYRRVVRNPFLQHIFLALPVSVRQQISDKIKQKSKQKKQFKTAMIMDVNQGEVLRVMREQEIDLLIHGHTHRPAIHSLETQVDHNVHRIVLGDWEDKASYLLVDDQQLTLHDHRVAESDSVLRLT
jgi:UDP-2,3-diacylglucosamine hydrolase